MAPSTPFAHASEAEMARILDFYAVRWEYEPDTFPILWNLDGDVVESFSPDFYLPDLDLYLEMTTLRQKLVRKKNRKLRRLRELYPAINIKLFYARDFRALMLKYGKLAVHDDIAGTSGQVALPYGEPGMTTADPGLPPDVLIVPPAVFTSMSGGDPTPPEAAGTTTLGVAHTGSLDAGGPTAVDAAEPTPRGEAAEGTSRDEAVLPLPLEESNRHERPSRSARRRRRAAAARAGAAPSTPSDAVHA